VGEPADDASGRASIRRVFANLGFLVRGRALAAVMMLGATVMMARALGPKGFGVVMLIQSYVLLIRGLLNFRSFEAVIRYGVPAHDAGDLQGLRRLLTLCHRVDRIACLVATVVALALAPLVGPLVGVGRGDIPLLAGYSLVLLTTGNNTADGILRLFDRFDSISWQMTIRGTLSLAGVAVAWWLGSPLAVFVGIMAGAYAVEELYMSWRGWLEYRRQMGRVPLDAGARDARMAEFPGLRRFLWVTYWQSNMDLVPKHLATVLAGALLGAASAGLVRLTRQISGVVSKPAVLIRQAVFPDLTRSWNQQRADFHAITYRVALYAGAVGLALVVIIYFLGGEFLGALVGNKFLAAVPLLTLMMLAAAFDLAAAPLRSAAYAVGQAGKVLWVYALATGIYLGLFVALTLWLGLIGIGIASCVGAALPLAVIAVSIRRGGGRQVA
jgi:O-antigen/teichoic acid export membrane protein